MQTRPKAAQIGRRSPIGDYIDVVRERGAFRNASRTFYGESVTPLEVARASSNVRARSIVQGISDEIGFAIIMDEPDYIIYSNDRPIAWHSTVRGIDSRALPPNPERWEWVIASPSPYYKFHHRIAHTVVTYLNGELDNA